MLGIFFIMFFGIVFSFDWVMFGFIWVVVLLGVVVLSNLLDLCEGCVICVFKGGIVMVEVMGIDMVCMCIVVFVIVVVLVVLLGWLYVYM